MKFEKFTLTTGCEIYINPNDVSVIRNRREAENTTMIGLRSGVELLVNENFEKVHNILIGPLYKEES